MISRCCSNKNVCLFNDGASTHVKEGASMFQNELTGVGFILTVIDIDVEFIRLQERTGEELGVRGHPFLVLTWNKTQTLTQVTKQ